MKDTATKIEVLNPLSLFNTVGKELRDFFNANDFEIGNLRKINIDPDQLDSQTKFTKQQIKKIVELTGVVEISNYLIDFQTDYLLSKEKVEKDFKKNVRIFNKIKHLYPLLKKDFENGIDLLEDISDFLGFQNEDEIFEKINENIALYKISNFEPDNLNLFAWLKRGEIDFHKLQLPTYDANSFYEWINDREWENNLNDKDYLNKLPDFLSKFGIGLIFTPYLNKTVYGAVRWFDDRPLVQISDKGKCLATVWYSLFHEFGHVIKHRNDQIFEGNLDLPKTQITVKEREANAFAYEYLFNGDNLRKHIFNFYGEYVNDAFIEEQSSNFNVNKMFVAYWMQKAQLKSKSINRHLQPISFE